MTPLRRPALKAFRSGFRVLLGHLWATRNETVQEDRLPTIATLYTVHYASRAACKVLLVCQERFRRAGVPHVIIGHTNKVGTPFGLWGCGGDHDEWMTPAELARELRR